MIIENRRIAILPSFGSVIQDFRFLFLCGHRPVRQAEGGSSFGFRQIAFGVNSLPWWI